MVRLNPSLFCSWCNHRGSTPWAPRSSRMRWKCKLENANWFEGNKPWIDLCLSENELDFSLHLSPYRGTTGHRRQLHLVGWTVCTHEEYTTESSFCMVRIGHGLYELRWCAIYLVACGIAWHVALHSMEHSPHHCQNFWCRYLEYLLSTPLLFPMRDVWDEVLHHLLFEILQEYPY